MADKRRVEIKGHLDTKQIEKAWKQTEKRLSSGAKKVGKDYKDASKEVSKATEKLVDEKTGQAMSRLNEQTERGRMLLNLMGGELAGVAGEMVFTGGSIAALIGKGELWMLGIMGVVGGLGILSTVIYKVTSGPYKELTEKTKELREETAKLRDTIDDMVEAEEFALAKLSNFDKERIKGKQQLYEIDHQLLKLRQFRMQLDEGDLKAKAEIKDLDNQIRQLEYERVRLEGSISDVSRIQRARKARDEIEASKKGKPGKAGGDLLGGLMSSAEGVFGKSKDKMVKDMQEYLDAQQKAYMDSITLENQYYTDSQRIAEDNANRKQRILKNQLDKQMEYLQAAVEKEKQIEKFRSSVADNSIALFERLGGMIAQTEAQRTAVEVAGIVARAIFKMNESMGAGFTALATPGMQWAAPMHFTAAGFHAVNAGMDVAGAIIGSRGGGGGGSSSGDRYRAQGGGGYSSMGQTTEETTIIVKLGDEELATVYHRGKTAHMDRSDPGRRRGEWS